MGMNRREFLHIMAMAGAAGLLPRSSFANEAGTANNADVYNAPAFGNVTLMHMTDCHAQLLPIYFREPNVNLGIGGSLGQAPHIVGDRFLKHFEIANDPRLSHAYTYLDFSKQAQKYGKVGGFAHLSTLIKSIRAERGQDKTLLMDGGDTWQGSGTSYKTKGKDMVEACNMLGVDVMTGHWEFTYQDKDILDNIKDFKGEFLAQNIKVKDEALFDGSPAFDEDSGHAFKPYTIKEIGGARVAIIGQAFPYTPIANPQRFIPDWTFGINDTDMQAMVDQIRKDEKPDVVVVLSHNGMDVDLKMASRVSGIDVIFGGHTHDGMPKPSIIKNAGGQTLVTNAGSNGKFLAVMDLDIRDGKMQGYRYRLLPIFSNILAADPDMSAYIDNMRKPHLAWLNEELTVTQDLLYRRGNFNGTFDQVICDALRQGHDAQISLSPGFRWGTSVLPGQSVTMEHVLDQTCITYPETYRREMTGAEVKAILEDVSDNLFNADPYYQQGGDMVRAGGLDYTCEPNGKVGERITEMRLDDGTALDPNKKYVVSGWATVSSKAPGAPIWDIVADYLRLQKDGLKLKKINTPKLKGIGDNPGLADYVG